MDVRVLVWNATTLPPEEAARSANPAISTADPANSEGKWLATERRLLNEIVRR
jgi:hypothetical protein